MVYDARGNQLIQPDPVLSNIAVGWAANSDQFIGEFLMPTVRVGKQAGKYYVFGLEAWQLPFNGDLRAPGTMANEVPGISLSQDNFFCPEHALEAPVTPEEREMAQGTPLAPDEDATELVTSKILLGKEILIRDTVYDTGNYAAAHTTTLAGTDQWNDAASDPIGDVRTAQRVIHSKIFRPANTMILPWEVLLELEDHPQMLARLAQNERQILTPELLAMFFGVERVLIPGSGYISGTQPPQAGNIDPADVSYVWGKKVWLGYVPPRPKLKEPAFGYTFVNPIGGRTMVTDRRQDLDRITTLIRVRHRYDTKLTAIDSNGDTYAGYLINDAVA